MTDRLVRNPAPRIFESSWLIIDLELVKIVQKHGSINKDETRPEKRDTREIEVFLIDEDINKNGFTFSVADGDYDEGLELIKAWKWYRSTEPTP